MASTIHVDCVLVLRSLESVKRDRDVTKLQVALGEDFKLEISRDFAIMR